MGWKKTTPCPVWVMAFRPREYVHTVRHSPSACKVADSRAVFKTGILSCLVQIIPATPSSFLRAGSRFIGTQQSERQVYDVQVEIKYVDLRESFLCGYLRIQGLSHNATILGSLRWLTMHRTCRAHR